MPAISCSAPGKIILCGEHAVVYHQPAIAIPVLSRSTTTKIFAHPESAKGEVIVRAEATHLFGNMDTLSLDDPIRRTVELVKDHFKINSLPACEIRISSTLPVAAGLGSSASLSCSIILALSEFLGHPLPVDQVNSIAFEAEKFHHGNPSGVDNTVIAYRRPVYFLQGTLVEFLTVSAPFHFIIGNTGIHASTAEAVCGVRQRWLKEPGKFDSLFSEIGLLSQQVRGELAQGGQSEVGNLLTQNHALLSELGVSCPELDHLVNTALQAGALGAKLSGGGLGGNMLALAEEQNTRQVEEALSQAGAISTMQMTLPASTEE
ncbi:MAG: mevalonate kinase [Anaerolineaceae bacterium]